MTEQMHTRIQTTTNLAPRDAYLAKRMEPVDWINHHIAQLQANPFVCFAENGDDGEGGGGDDEGAEKKFSQADLDTLVKRRLAQEQRKHEKALKALEAKLEGVSELEEQLEELKAKLENPEPKGGDSKETIEKAEFDRVMREHKKAMAALEKLTAEKAEIEAARDAAVGRYNGTRVADAARNALSKAGVMTKAQAVAVDTFVREMRAQLHIDDDGKEHVFVTDEDGTEHADIEDAAASFLKRHDYWKSHPGGGAGEGGNSTKNRTGVNGWKPGDLDNLDETAALEAAFSAD